MPPGGHWPANRGQRLRLAGTPAVQPVPASHPCAAVPAGGAGLAGCRLPRDAGYSRPACGRPRRGRRPRRVSGAAPGMSCRTCREGAGRLGYALRGDRRGHPGEAAEFAERVLRVRRGQDPGRSGVFLCSRSGCAGWPSTVIPRTRQGTWYPSSSSRTWSARGRSHGCPALAPHATTTVRSSRPVHALTITWSQAKPTGSGSASRLLGSVDTRANRLTTSKLLQPSRSAKPRQRRMVASSLRPGSAPVQHHEGERRARAGGRPGAPQRPAVPAIGGPAGEPGRAAGSRARLVPERLRSGHGYLSRSGTARLNSSWTGTGVVRGWPRCRSMKAHSRRMLRGSAGRVGAPALCRTRLLESAATGPARRAAPGRHRAAVPLRRRPARCRTALGNRTTHPAAR